jgi:flagellar basal-body rod protein FlgG
MSHCYKKIIFLNCGTENRSETQYTRAGNFYLNPMGDGRVMLTTSDGFPVIGEDGNEILLENGFTELSIDKNGMILVSREGEQSVEAQLNVVEAVRPRMLESTGDNRFRLPADIALDGVLQDTASQDVQIQSQAIEASNVNISNQMTDMLMAQRAYQFNAKSITTSDQMMGLVNQLRT